MRKITDQMIQAINNGKEWQETNTKVRPDNSPDVLDVFNYGKKIATVYWDAKEITLVPQYFNGKISHVTSNRLKALAIEYTDYVLRKVKGVDVLEHRDTGKQIAFDSEISLPFSKEVQS